MRIHGVQQNTFEWLKIRSGIPTASEFDRIMTKGGEKSKSTQSKQAPAYMNELLSERLMGHPTQQKSTKWMERGQELEGDALAYYEFQRGVSVEKIGFVTNDAGNIGCSPDCLVGNDGLLEIKCPSEGVHVSYLLEDVGAADQYKHQTQGQLWITGRKWVDIVSYHPEMPSALYRVERDHEFIELLSLHVSVFVNCLESLWKEFCEVRKWGNAEAWERRFDLPKPKPDMSQRGAIDEMREVMIETQYPPAAPEGSGMGDKGTMQAAGETSKSAASKRGVA